jgi:HAD superfamily hydrolase (TIGR01490 family)
LNAGAVFDLDGTLIRGTSAERLFVPYLARARLLGIRQWLPFLATACSLPFAGWTVAMRRNKRYLTNLDCTRVQKLVPDFVTDVLEPRFCSPVVERLKELRTEGYAICLLTGAPDFIAEAVGRHLGAVESTGTRLLVRDGRYTGGLAGPHYFAGEKTRALREIARRHQLDLSLSYAFADHVHDIPVLEAVGHPVAVDPKPGLERHARQQGWEVMRC